MADENELVAGEIIDGALRLREAGVRAVVLSGGEFLALPEATKILSRLASIGLQIGVCTNGRVTDTTARARELRALGLNWLAISLDGPEPAIHDEVRGRPGSFDSAVEAMRCCREAELPFSADVTVTRPWSSRLREMFALLSELRPNRAVFRRFIPLGRGRAFRSGLELTVPEHREWIRRCFELGRAQEIPFTIADPTTLPVLVAAGYGVEEVFSIPHFRFRFGCLALRYWFGIQPEGNITACPLLSSSLGNIRQIDDPGRIFRSPDRRRRSGESEGNPIVLRCAATALGYTGDDSEMDPFAEGLTAPRGTYEELEAMAGTRPVQGVIAVRSG